MRNLLIVTADTDDYNKNVGDYGRYPYMVRHLSNRYRIQILNYYTSQGHERIIKKLLHPAKENEEGTPIKTLGVKLLFEDLPLKSRMFSRYLYPLFFTFLQPIFVVLISFKRLGKSDICVAGGLWGGIIGCALSSLGKTGCLVYEDLDLFPFFWDNKLFQTMLYAIEKFVVKKADLVVSVSDALAELRRRQGAKNVIVVPNGVDYNLFSKGQSKKTHSQTLVYVGGLVEYQGIDLPIRCLPEIAKAFPNIRFLVLGTGLFENELRILIKKLRLERSVFLLGGQEHEKLPDYFSESDIAVATAKSSILTQYSSPYKIPEYLAAGLPIITTKIDDRQELQSRLKGIVSINLRERDFKDVVLSLFSDAELYRDLSEKAIRTAKESDWTDLFKIEFDEIEKTFEEKALKE